MALRIGWQESWIMLQGLNAPEWFAHASLPASGSTGKLEEEQRETKLMSLCRKGDAQRAFGVGCVCICTDTGISYFDVSEG
jgi:hypothetical protein